MFTILWNVCDVQYTVSVAQFTVCDIDWYVCSVVTSENLVESRLCMAKNKVSFVQGLLLRK